MGAMTNMTRGPVIGSGAHLIFFSPPHSSPRTIPATTNHSESQMKKTRRAQIDAANDPDVVETEPELEQEDESEPSSDDEQFSEQEEAPVRKSKRPRTTRAKQKAPRKKYVRGKQGSLEGIMKMPMEIFAEITSYITPGDLVSLLRTNKFFRQILLQRSSVAIWQCAQRNVPNLPPCLTGLSEPQYAVLLFSKICTLCGSSAPAQPDPYLRVRLCPSCRDTKLEEVPLSHQNPRIDYQYVAKSGFTRPKIKSAGRHAVSGYFCFREDVDEIVRRRKEFLRKKNAKGLADWERKLKRTVGIQTKEGNRLRVFIDSVVTSRSSELNEVKKERRDTIHKRLNELGWEEKYFKFHGEHAKPWKALVEVPKPLTERIWTNILPKLIALLEENRDRILEAEKQQRRSRRREKLHSHLRKVKRAAHPYQAIIDALGVEINSDTLSDDPIVFPNPFPESAVALKWDFMLDMYEEEISLEQVEELFNVQRAQLDQRVLEWRADVESQLVERHGADLDGKDDSDIIVTVQGSTDITQHLSRNARFLLRADTIFTRATQYIIDPRTDQTRLLWHFPSLASTDDFGFDIIWPGIEKKPAIRPKEYIRNAKMETIAKALLKNIGMPDVAHIEMTSMRRVFVCGRCEDTKPKSWNNMLLHYLEQLQRWTTAEKSRSALSTRHPIVFRNTHDHKSKTNPKPLVRILSTQEAEEAAPVGPGHIGDSWDTSICMLCIGLGLYTGASPGQMQVHLKNVHDVEDPVEGIHLRIGGEGASLSDLEDETEWYDQWDAFNDAQLSEGSTSAASAAGSPSATAAASSGAAS